MVLWSGACLPVSQITSTLRWHSASSSRRGTNPVEVAVKIEFEQHGRIVRRRAGGGDLRLGKTQRGQVEVGHEGIQEAHGVFGGDIILQPFGKEQGLGTIQAGAMVHACQTPAKARCSNSMSEFLHSLALQPTATAP